MKPMKKSQRNSELSPFNLPAPDVLMGLKDCEINFQVFEGKHEEFEFQAG